MILNSILQLLDPLSQLVDLTLPNSEKKNRKTKRITQNPSNRRQRRTQDKKNHHVNITESARTMKSSQLFR